MLDSLGGGKYSATLMEAGWYWFTFVGGPFGSDCNDGFKLTTVGWFYSEKEQN
jgi:hypothetical protein